MIPRPVHVTVVAVVPGGLHYFMENAFVDLFWGLWWSISVVSLDQTDDVCLCVCSMNGCAHTVITYSG